MYSNVKDSNKEKSYKFSDLLKITSDYITLFKFQGKYKCLRDSLNTSVIKKLLEFSVCTKDLKLAEFSYVLLIFIKMKEYEAFIKMSKILNKAKQR